MFKALVVILIMGTPGPVVLEDTRGPYETLKDCKVRVKEMLLDGRKLVMMHNPWIKEDMVEARGVCTEENRGVRS